VGSSVGLCPPTIAVSIITDGLIIDGGADADQFPLRDHNAVDDTLAVLC